MKNKLLYILSAAGILVALTACEPKYSYSWTSYVVVDETSVSIAEDDSLGVLTLGVTAYVHSGSPNTEVTFELIDGEGENGAKNGVDYTIVSPVNGVLFFDGEATKYIQIRISNADVGIYTGRKRFEVKLTGASNGYQLGGAYSTTVTITDSDKNLDAVGMAGTYVVTGQAYVSSGTVGEKNWEMVVVQDETNPDLLYCDGVVPLLEGYYYEGGVDYCAQCYMDNDDTMFVIPSQVLNFKNNGYYLGIYPCTEYDGTYFYYSTLYPDLVFYLNSDGTWTSNYGEFLMALLSNSLDSADGFFDVTVPTMKLTKVE